MSSLVNKNDGVYNPSLRFAFTNITEEDFVSAWGGSPIVVKAGQTVELPHHLADKMTDELVNKIMIGNAKLDEVEYYKKNPNTQPNMYRAASSLGVPAARKIWEDKIVRPLAVDEESPEIQVMRAQIKEEIMNDLKEKPSSQPVAVPTNISEFAELKQAGEEKEAPKEKKPLKVKTLPK